MDSLILHSDLNCFYASVEMNENPALAGKKVAVCGSTENRHGIVLTASYSAKRSGVKTGMANWQARQACRDLITVEPHYDLYMKYSRLVREIYARYSNDIEPFGMDENWLRFEGVHSVEKDGSAIADEIRKAVKVETGLTVSVGASFNKIFAKLGSDMKKPNAVTVISRENYKEKIWPLAVSELLYVGPATTRKLKMLSIHTIGDLAQCNPELLLPHLGKNGIMLWRFANGSDTSPVMPADYKPTVKSIGHGTTCIKDLDNNYEVWLVLYELAQDIGRRARDYGITIKGVQITVRDNELAFQQYQAQLPYPTQSPLELAQAGYILFRQRYSWDKQIRALTIRGITPGQENDPIQTDIFNDYGKRQRQQTLDDTINRIRDRFGYSSIKPASLMTSLYMAQDKCETILMPGLMYSN